MGFKTKVIVGILGVAAVGGGLTYWTMGRDKNPQSQLIKGTVDRGTIRITVTATGTVEAVRTVQVGSQISGQIAALHADYNSQVRKGQLLAEIDPRTFESQVLTEKAQNAAADARMQSSQADLINQEANLVQVEANLKVVQVANENAALLYERAKQLMAKGLVPQNDLDLARMNAESAAAKVIQAQAAVRQASAQIRSREAAVQGVKSDIVGAKAQLERAEINLELTKIYSPVDGVVISRSIDIGQTVAASLSAPTLFLIANDLTRMQVKANIDEADIGKITPDVRTSFTVDAYPNDTFSGQIIEVRLEPQTVQNVVTYGVIIGVENPQLKLKPGMTANLTMTVEEHQDVLTVQNAALRFTPPGLTQEQVTKMVQDLPQIAPPIPPTPTEGAAARPEGQEAPQASASGEQGREGQGRGGRGGGRGRGGDGGGGRGGGRGGGQGRNAVLWTQDATTGAFKPIRVRTGLTDGTRTEVTGPDVKEGMEIMVSDLSQTSTNTQQRPANSPFVPNIGGGRGRGGF